MRCSTSFLGQMPTSCTLQLQVSVQTLQQPGTTRSTHPHATRMCGFLRLRTCSGLLNKVLYSSALLFITKHALHCLVSHCTILNLQFKPQSRFWQTSRPLQSIRFWIEACLAAIHGKLTFTKAVFGIQWTAGSAAYAIF